MRYCSTLWVTNKGIFWEGWKGNNVMNFIRSIMSPLYAVNHHRLFVTFTLPGQWSLFAFLFLTIIYLWLKMKWLSWRRNLICDLLSFICFHPKQTKISVQTKPFRVCFIERPSPTNDPNMTSDIKLRSTTQNGRKFKFVSRRSWKSLARHSPADPLAI